MYRICCVCVRFSNPSKIAIDAKLMNMHTNFVSIGFIFLPIMILLYIPVNKQKLAIKTDVSLRLHDAIVKVIIMIRNSVSSVRPRSDLVPRHGLQSEHTLLLVVPENKFGHFTWARAIHCSFRGSTWAPLLGTSTESEQFSSVPAVFTF